jgi:hypothetical protein
MIVEHDAILSGWEAKPKPRLPDRLVVLVDCLCVAISAEPEVHGVGVLSAIPRAAILELILASVLVEAGSIYNPNLIRIPLTWID